MVCNGRGTRRVSTGTVAAQRRLAGPSGAHQTRHRVRGDSFVPISFLFSSNWGDPAGVDLAFRASRCAPPFRSVGMLGDVEETPLERQQRYAQEDDIEDVAEAIGRAAPNEAGQRSLTMGEIKAACGKSLQGLPLLLNVMRSKGRVAFDGVFITRDDTLVTLVEAAADGGVGGDTGGDSAASAGDPAEPAAPEGGDDAQDDAGDAALGGDGAAEEEEEEKSEEER